jgi:hypothetical protein
MVARAGRSRKHARATRTESARARPTERARETASPPPRRLLGHEIDRSSTRGVPHAAEMERVFGEDFSSVETSLGAVDTLAAIGASAATEQTRTGARIAFASRSPSRADVAHELTHVVQHRRAPSARVPAIGSHNAPAEREASRVANAVAQGTLIGPLDALPAGMLQRQPEGSSVTAPSTDDEGTDVPPSTCAATVGTFVLDPSIEFAPPPANMTTQIRVAGLRTGEPERLIQIQRRITNAERIVLYAVPLGQCYSTQEEAAAAPLAGPMVMTSVRTLTEPYLGDTVWTPSGPIQVIDVRPTNYVMMLPNADELVLTTSPSLEAVGAAAVILLWTDAGNVLIEAGMQLQVEDAGLVLGEKLAELVASRFGSTHVGEAVVEPHRSPHVLPIMATRLELQSIRATRDQVDDGTVTEILRARRQYRQWLESNVRHNLESTRSEWEATQPIATNQSIREQRWQAHVEAEVSVALRLPAPSLHVVGEDASGMIDLDTDLESIDQIEDLPEGAGTTPGTAIDLSDVEWEAADDEAALIFGSNGRVAPITATGLVLRPRATAETGASPPPVPEATHVPELRPAGPVGLGPHVPRSVRPHLALAAIGKNGMALVRLANGFGFLIDAGAPRVIALDALSRHISELGISGIAGMGITHMHADHTRTLIDIIKQHNIHARDLVISRAWQESSTASRIRARATPTDQRASGSRHHSEPFDQQLSDLGYGAADWGQPGIDMTAGAGPSTPGTAQTSRVTITVGGTPIDIYAEVGAQRTVAAGYAAGTARAPHVDAAALLYVFGGPSAPNRTAVIGDLRGEDITTMIDGMGGPGPFAEAMRGVRIVYGFGHHFGEAAAQTAAEVTGWNALLEATLIQNGELTIVVQSSEGFAFGAAGGPTTAGREGALLRYLERMGARVIFGGESTATTAGDTVTSPTGSGQLDTAGGFTSTGTGVRSLTSPDPRLAEIQRRASLLREAKRTLHDHPELAPEALGLPGQDAATLEASLDGEIRRIENGLRELLGNASADLLDARGLDPSEAGDRAAFRAAHATARSDADILADCEQRGTIEQQLSEDVMRRLESASGAGRSLAVDLAFRAMPPDVLAVLNEIGDAAMRDSIAAKYRELADITAQLEGDMVPAANRAEILLRATELRTQLQLALEHAGSTTTASRTPIHTEVARLTRVIERLGVDAARERVSGRSIEGHPTETQYIRFNEALGSGLHALGRGMGAVMVIHSIRELAVDTAHVAAGDMTLPESIFRLSHAAYGINLGVRMARTTMLQARSGVGGVSNWEFAIMAVLEVGAAASAHYTSAEERRAAIEGTAVHAAVDLLCMTVGQWVVETSIAAPIPPPLKLLGVGLGLAIMFGGSRIIGALGLDEWLEHRLNWLPDSLEDVTNRIGAGLREYQIMIGAQQVAQRPGAELEALGVRYPWSTLSRAESVVDEEAHSVRRLESEITGLFETAYREARSSFVGLQLLDHQATEFMRLRQAAFSGHADPARADLDERWRAIDASLDLSHETRQTIHDMPQWTYLDGKFRELDGYLAEDTPETARVLDAIGKIQLLIGNARYRLDPTRGGQRDALRTRGLLEPGEARDEYIARLTDFEQRLTRYQSALTRLGLGTYGPNDVSGEQPDASPTASLARLRRARATYDRAVLEATQAHPNLASSDVWANTDSLVAAIETANRDDRQRFERLRFLELALELATNQAASSVSIASESPPELIRQAITDETRSAREAMQRRKMHLGLVFVDEIDEIRAERSAQDQQILAGAIDAAYPRSHECDGPASPPELGEEEITALRSSQLGGDNSGISSTQHQLAEANHHREQWRDALTPGVDPLHDWAHMSRLPAPQLARLRNPYRRHGSFLGFRTNESVGYASNLEPIVALLGNSWTEGTWTPEWFSDCIAINADARTVLGTGVVRLSHRTLDGISLDDIRQRAEAVGPRTHEEPAR